MGNNEVIMEFQIKPRKDIGVKKAMFLDFKGNLITDSSKNAVAGNQHVLISDNDAKRVGKVEEYTDGTRLYFIKAVKFGNPGELLVNPFETNVLSAYNETDSRSRSFYYLKVNEEIFDLYVRFLYTRNEPYLLNITRRIKDGEL